MEEKIRRILVRTLWFVFGGTAFLGLISIVIDGFKNQELFQRETGAFALVMSGFGKYILLGFVVIGVLFILERCWRKLTSLVQQERASDEPISKRTDSPKKRRLNPFLCKSEGLRRVSILLFALGLGSWFTFVGFQTNGFIGIPMLGWLVFFVVIPIGSYLAVMLVRTTYLWVAAGFRLPPN